MRPRVAAQRASNPLWERNRSNATAQTRCGKARFQLSANVSTFAPRRSDNQTATSSASADEIEVETMLTHSEKTSEPQNSRPACP